MAAPVYKFIRQAWRNPDQIHKRILPELRAQPAMLRIEKPTRLDRARALGYKAKQGILLVRVRIRRGGRKRSRPTRGRRTKRMGIYLKPEKSLQRMAEERVARKYPNLEVLNSYLVAQDGQHKWFEVILVDPSHPAIKSDQDLNWICSGKHRGRAFRGLTSAGRKGRGLTR